MKKIIQNIFKINKLSYLLMFLTIFIFFSSSNNYLSASSRIKDIVNFEGIRDNILVGYGLVVGLNGSGDSLGNSPFTKQSLEGMLERLGVNTRGSGLNTKNVAAVMVSANLPPFARQGSRIDLNVSTLGDAKSLLGGTLLVTPLVGANGQVYAVGQGPVLVGGFEAQGAAATIVKGVPTAGRVPQGAIVEQEISFELSNLNKIRISMKNPDFTTANRIANTINSFLGNEAARVKDPGTISLVTPENYSNKMVKLLTDIEQLRVETDQPARVVIDEATGVIVLGNDVKVNTVAIALGTLSISITETPQVSQPQPFASKGETVTVPRTTIEVTQDDKKLAVVKESVNLQDLVNGLNSLGIGPRDMISILQALKTAGALQADIRLM
ncbi:MAG: Flagellar P-ring protein [Alphaproteobacteria bacterium MarineAlpha2_Bin1]|nr:MAG: Flagellar P-ring protein [Alphaproteobacteria bacterium MarineAlpha2_Bin1]|tara:strand:+ start:334 stop:1482 length:1149 start_codon:yes stop_codon:yes gene_type:complete